MLFLRSQQEKIAILMNEELNLAVEELAPGAVTRYGFSQLYFQAGLCRIGLLALVRRLGLQLYYPVY